MTISKTTDPCSIEFAMELDSVDPLQEYRQRFYIPKDNKGKESIYFSGNSLGLQCKDVSKHVMQELCDWQELGVEGHFHAKNPWLPYHEMLTDRMAKVIGARPSEVVTMNSLTANLHFMMVSFYRPTKERYKILVNPHMFPSDRYALQSQVKFHGFDPIEAIIELPSRNSLADMTDLKATLDEEGNSIALIWIEGVNYYSGQAFPLKEITELGHKNGCIVGFDLAHAVGNIELNLHQDGVDFAVWCTYKYLNGGPGCPGGCFVNERHHEQEMKRFAGWWGHDKEVRFLMEPEFKPIVGAEGWQLSNPPILSLAALNASLDVFEEVGMAKLNQKREKMVDYLRMLIGNLPDSKISIITPKEKGTHGCQLSLRFHEKGKETYKTLKESGVIADWREPDIVRIAPVPLYNSFADLYYFYDQLKTLITMVNL